MTIEQVLAGGRVDDFRFRLIERRGDVCLLAKRRDHHTRDTYEVVILQPQPAKTVFGVDYPARMSLPSAEQWGQAGWSYLDEQSARVRFDALMPVLR